MIVPVAARPGQPRPRRRRRAGGNVLAGVRRRPARRNVLVRHLLSHTAGLPGWEQRSSRPTSTTGTRSRRCSPSRRRGGSRVRSRATTASPRATWSARSCAGSTAARVGTFFAEEIAGPLGADFHIGTPRRARRPRRPRDPRRRRSSSAAPGGRPEIPTGLDPVPRRQPAPRRRAVVGDPVAAGRDPGRRRPRQRPQRRPRAVGRVGRRHGARRRAAVGADASIGSSTCRRPVVTSCSASASRSASATA